MKKKATKSVRDTIQFARDFLDLLEMAVSKAETKGAPKNGRKAAKKTVKAKKPGRPAKKRGRPAKKKVAVAKKRGRPVKKKVAVAKKRGRPAKKKVGAVKKKAAKTRAVKTKKAAGAVKRRGRPAKKSGRVKKVARKGVKTPRVKLPSLDPATIDYSLDVETFAKKYADGRGGTRKFVLLLARHAKGKAGVDVRISDVRSEWAMLKSKNQVGDFNGLYPSQAKSKGWVKTPKRGIYTLSPSWTGCL